jgi:hypothetical protein
MRVSINAIDDVITIDGTAGLTDCAALFAQGISAVQWRDDIGELEFVGHSKPNEVITEFTPYQSYVDNAVPIPEPEPPPLPDPPPPPVVFEPPEMLTPDQQVMFDHENRTLALEGKPPMTEADFMSMLKAKAEAYNAVMNAAFQEALAAQDQPH